MLDEGEGGATVLVLGGAAEREHDLGGLQERTLGEHLASMRALHGLRPARRVLLPDWLAGVTARACDLLHWTPFSYGHWELLQRDNCPRDNRLPALLGRAPRAVGASILPTTQTGTAIADGQAA